MKSAGTTSPQGRILVVETDASVAESITMILGEGGQGHHVTTCDDGHHAFTLATTGLLPDDNQSNEAQEFDLVLSAFRLPGMGGLELLGKLREHNPYRPFILMSANANTELAIEATKQGAYDYLIRPFDSNELIDIVEQGLRASQTMGKQIQMGKSSSPETQVKMLGNCAAMRKVYKEIGRFAPTTATVLIHGETGTGKELVARALFQHSERSKQPFVAVNCGAIPDNLLESELFGHIRGAFTGAVSNRIGRFQQADGGTLFLDEIGDLPMPVQVKLLRVLQEGIFQQLGDTKDIHVDVRIVAATHQNIPHLINEGQFREDLFYRINTAIIELPPLRERGDDALELINHFANLAAQEYNLPRPDFPKPVLRRLTAHPWPGNARELGNVITQLVVRSRGFAISPELVEMALQNALPDESREETDFTLSILGPIRDALEDAKKLGSGNVHQELVRDLEEQLIRTALQLASGHLGHVSDWIGISRVTLRKKMKVYGINS